MDTQMSVAYRKFHPIFGFELQLYLEANFQSGDHIVEGENPFREEMIHRKGECVRYYYTAVSDYADLAEYDQGWIQFVPWFTTEDLKYLRIGLFAQAFNSKAKNFWLWFGRQGEEKPFTFSPDRAGHLQLDFMSRNPVFQPLFVKVRNRKSELNDMPEIVAFVIEVAPESEKNGVIQLLLRQVSEAELPPCLKDLRP